MVHLTKGDVYSTPILHIIYRFFVHQLLNFLITLKGGSIQHAFQVSDRETHQLSSELAMLLWISY